MFFFDKLQLLELLRQDDVETYRAADKATGQDYLLHWLPPDGSPQLARVMSLLDGLDEDARRLLIEVGRRNGRAYLITQNPPTFIGLEAWLQAVKDFLGTTSLEKKGTWKIPAEFIRPKSPTADAPSRGEPGEFTRLMRAAPAPEPVRQEPITSQENPPQAGDFTLLMRQSSSVSPPSAPGQTDPPTPQPDPPQPGDFTRYMRQVQPPPPPAEPPAPAGEFTRLMQANPAHPPAQPERVIRPVPRQEAGEFTRLFAPAASDSNDRTPRQPAGDGLPGQAQPGEFTRLFRLPTTQPTPLSPREDPFSQPGGSSQGAAQVFDRPAVQPAPVPRPSEAPGEYTRMFGTPADAPPIAAPGAPSRPQPGEFTRLFQSPASQPTPLLPREDPFSQPYSHGESSSDFNPDFGSQAGNAPDRSSSSGQGATQVFARPAVQPAPVARPVEGPGEYTRMFGTPAVAPPAAAPSAPPPAAAPSAPPPAVKKKTEPALWIFLAVLTMLAICAVILIVYFTLKK